MTKTALIIVDIQNDFCENGALAVNGGNAVAKGVAELLRTDSKRFDLVVTTQDWHVDPGDHFKTWPVHCVANSEGAALHSEIEAAIWNQSNLVSVRKGQFGDAYSGFEGTTETGEKLVDVLRSQGVTDLVVVGLAYDHCVKATSVDGAAAGFNVIVSKDLSASVDPSGDDAVTTEIENAGAEVI